MQYQTETIETLDISPTERVRVVPDTDTYPIEHIVGDDFGVYTIAIDRNYNPIYYGNETDGIYQLARRFEFDRDKRERAIGLYLSLAGKYWKRVSLRGHSQGDWAEVIVYADDAYIMQPDAEVDLQAWFAGDIYGLIRERLVEYAEIGNPDNRITQWQEVDSIYAVMMSATYNAVDAARDNFSIETA